jgi:hypothetical protein
MREAADQLDDREVDRVEAIVRSMTGAERTEPAIVDGSRRQRIATGSGTTVAQVNQLLRQFKEMQKMMRSMGGGAGVPQLGGMSGKLARAASRHLPPDAMPPQLGGLSSALSAPLGRELPSPPPRRPGSKKKKGGRVTPPKQR